MIADQEKNLKEGNVESSFFLEGILSKEKTYTVIAMLLIVFFLITISIPYLGVVASSLIAVLFSARFGGITLLGLKKPPWGFLTTLLIAMAMAGVIVAVIYFILLPLIESATSQSLRLGGFSAITGNPRAFAFYITVGWVIGGFLEEILFRGFLLAKISHLMKGRAGEVLAIIMTSAFFGFLHGYQGVTGQILTGIAGLFLGGLFILNNKNVWLNIFVHGFLNTWTMTLLYLGWL